MFVAAPVHRWFRGRLWFTVGEAGVRSVPKGALRRIRDCALGASACEFVLVETGGEAHRFAVPNPSRTARLMIEACDAAGRSEP